MYLILPVVEGMSKCNTKFGRKLFTNKTENEIKAWRTFYNNHLILNYLDQALSAGLRICWLYHLRGDKTLTPKECIVYDYKLHLMVKFSF